jgi:hypothetical protein
MRSIVVFIQLLISPLLLNQAYGQEPTLSRKDIYKRCVMSELVGKIEDLSSISDENAFLSSLNPSSILPKTAKGLSQFPNVVIKISDSADRTYVIRRTMSFDGGKTSNVPFEHFSNLFARDIPGVHVPALRVLSPQDSQSLIARLKAEGHIIDESHEGMKFDDTKVSVTPFYQAETGHDYLNKIGIDSELRDHIIHFRSVLWGQSSDDVKIELVQAWLDASPAQKKTIREDLAILVPAFRKVSDSKFPGALMKNFDKLMTDKVSKGLTIRSWYRLPEHLRTQLANHWALNEALGIDDFHWENWMIRDGHMIGIDLAKQTNHFDSGSATIGHQYAGIQSNLDSGEDILQTFFRANISPKTRDYLLSLTADQIRDIAARANFPINQRQIKGILARIAAVCKRP